MKKRFLAVPLAIGVASASWAGTTLYGGSEARQAYERLLVELNDASGLSFVQASYDAGFLHSEAITELRTGAADDADVLVRLRHVIEHSPVGNAGLRAARIVTTAEADASNHPDAAWIAALFDGETPLTIDSVIGLDGDAEHTVTIAAWQHDGPLGPVDSAAMSWSIRHGSDGSVSGTGFWPGLSFTSDDGAGFSLTLGASHDRFDYRKDGSGLYVGDYAAEFGDLAITMAGTGLGGTLSNMRATTSATVVDDAYRGDAAFEIGAMDLPVELDSLRLHLVMDGLPTRGLDKVRTTGNEWDMAALGDDLERRESALAAHVSALGTLLRPGLSLAYGVDLANAGGRATANWDMAYVGDGSANALASMQTVGDLLAALRTTVTLDIDADALALTPAAMFIEPQSLAPWVVTDDDGYRAHIVLAGNRLDVNGQPMPIEVLVGDMLSLPLQGLLDEAI